MLNRAPNDTKTNTEINRKQIRGEEIRQGGLRQLQ